MNSVTLDLDKNDRVPMKNWVYGSSIVVHGKNGYIGTINEDVRSLEIYICTCEEFFVEVLLTLNVPKVTHEKKNNNGKPILLQRTPEKKRIPETIPGRETEESNRYQGFVLKRTHNKTLQRGYKGSFNHMYRLRLKEKFGDNSITTIKLHIQYDMMNGLDFECKLFYIHSDRKSIQVRKTFRKMLKNVLNKRNIDDLFENQGDVNLAKVIIKIYTMETFLYKVLTKTQREKTKDKVLTMSPFNEMFNKSLDILRQKDNEITVVYRGALLDNDDLEIWKEMKRTEEPVCVPCHSSTSRLKRVAVQYLRTRTNEKEPVLFVFKFPNGIDNDSLSVDVKHFSQFPNEEELLVDPQQEFVVSEISSDRYTTITLKKDYI